MGDEVEKQYTLKMDHHESYLHVTVSGARVTSQIALDYWREVIAECDRIGYSKILLEHNFVEMISLPEMLEVIGPVTEMLQGRILAFYDGCGNYDIPEAGKAILRTHNVKMQIFHDLEHAERWLRSN